MIYKLIKNHWRIIFPTCIFIILLGLKVYFASNICNEFLRTNYIKDFQIYLTGKTELTKLSSFICHGSIVEQNIEDEYYLVLFSKQLYFLFSHIFLILLALVMKYLKFNNIQCLYNLFLFFIFINLVFNYPLGLNFLNELIINHLIIFFVLSLSINVFDD